MANLFFDIPAGLGLRVLELEGPGPRNFIFGVHFRGEQ
jgi:hypothetical protein